MTELPVIQVDEVHRVTLPPDVDPERTLVFSSTQFDGADRCERYWWFKWGVRLPTLDKGYLTFGKVLHAVLERYLKADDLGRTEDGSPVNIYPAGWAAEITPQEADLIQKLVQEAIDQGVITRGPGRRVEHSFLHELDRHRPFDSDDEWRLFVTGFIDLLLPDEVQDHKTTGNMRYAKSPKALRESNQMLLYAAEAIHQAAQRGVDLQEVTIRHNVFLKDPELPAIKAVKAKVTRQQVEHRIHHLRQRAREMLALKRKFAREEQWHDVPEPPEAKRVGACMAYGGCPYLLICGGRESPQQYRTRVENQIAHKNGAGQERKMSVSVFQRNVQGAQQAQGVAPPVNGQATAGATAGGPAGSPTDKFYVHINGQSQPMTRAEIEQGLTAGSLALTTQGVPMGGSAWAQLGALGFQVAPAAPPAPPAAPPPPTAPAPVLNAPPWAQPGCTACGGSGFNSKGAACPICDGLSAQQGKATSHQFDLVTAGDGSITWRPKTAAPASPPAPPAAPAAPPTAPMPAPAPQPEVKAPSESNETEEDAGKKPGRPKTSFTLLINCTVSVGKNPVDLASVLASVGTELATRSQAESYYDLDPFKRRDALAGVAERISADLKGKTVIANGDSPDLKALRDALRGYASSVIEGVR